jgi:protein-S-isoprenylcysteine O-methyltransferase Ste14
MIAIGNFFFKYRNLIFPIFGLLIFIPSPPLFSVRAFGENYYAIPLIAGLTIAITGQIIRALTVGLKYIVRGGKHKKVYAEDLVTEGLFHHCRNPLYIGNILMLTGVGLMSNSLIFIIMMVPLFCFIYQAIVLAEENYLRGKFGAGYDEYTRTVNRWLPNLKGLSGTVTSMKFNWQRYVVSEYNTLYLLLMSILIVLMTYHPALVRLTLQAKTRISLICFLLVSIIYLVVRWLKKSRRLKRNPI